MNSYTHPSYLELDRLHLGVGSETTRRHVESCEHCAGHLSRLSLGAGNVPEAIQARLLQHEPFWKRGRGVWAGAALASVMGLCVAVALMSTRGLGISEGGNVTDPVDGIRAKAAQPAVALFIKRGERVLQWDGQAPIQPGDRLRLEVAPEGFRRVKVSTPQAGASTVLYEGELEGGASALLPLSFQVDSNGQAEVLDILLSAGRGPEESWSTKLVLEKSPSVDGGGTQ